MLPIPANIKFIVLVVLVGAIGALQAIAPLEPTWAWIAAVVKMLAVAEAFFTVPQGAADKLAASAAKVRAVLPLVFVAAVAAIGVATQTGCPSAVPVVGPAASCVSAVIADALAGMTVAQILTKEGAGCVADASEIVTILLGSKDPAVQQTKAFAMAKAMRAAEVGQ